MYKNKTSTSNNLYCKRIKAIRQHLPQKTSQRKLAETWYEELLDDENHYQI